MALLRNRYVLLATLSYLVFGLVWILLSDQILSVFADVNSAIWLSTAKGLFFVVISALAFYFALRSMPDHNATGRIRLRDVVFSGFSIKRTSALISYSFAILITLLAIYVRFNFGITSDHRPLVALFILPILLSALLGGFWPGVISTILAFVGISYFMLSPIHSSGTPDVFDFLQLATLSFCGVTISIFCETLLRLKSKGDNHLKLLNMLVSTSNDPIYVKDTNGCYLLINKAAADLVGKSVEEILGKDDTFLFPDSVAKRIMVRDHALLQNGTIERHEETLITYDGKSLIVDVNKGVISDHAGKTVGLFGISRDVTANKMLEQQRINHEIIFRKSLIREVHHRIKNSLQGTTGLLEQTISIHPELKEAINKVISKIQGIATIHGLQGHHINSEVELLAMIETIVDNNQKLWGKSLSVTISPNLYNWIVSELESVPLALIINELLLNAVKHHSVNDKKIEVSLTENIEKNQVTIDISNNGKLLHENNPSKSIFKGAGLELIELLLPKSGVLFSLVETDNTVTASLILSNPVIVAH